MQSLTFRSGSVCSVPCVLPDPYLPHYTDLSCFNKKVKYAELKEKGRQTFIPLLDIGIQVTILPTSTAGRQH